MLRDLNVTLAGLIVVALLTSCASETATSPPTHAATTAAQRGSEVTPRTSVPIPRASSSRPTPLPNRLLAVRDGAVVTYNSDGTGFTQVSVPSKVAAGAVITLAAWSPDESRIAIESTLGTPAIDYAYLSVVSVVDTRVISAVQVQPAGGQPADPAWSPDGTQLAIVLAGADGYVGKIEVVTPSATIKPRDLTKGEDDSFPAWSPDGTKIAFARDNQGVFGVNAADGTGLRHLTNISGVAAGLAWSPNGTEIAFADRSPTGYNAIYVMGSDGAGRRLLAATPNADDEGPAWSPDGKSVAFVARSAQGSAIEVVPTTGGKPAEIAQGAFTSVAWRGGVG